MKRVPFVEKLFLVFTLIILGIDEAFRPSGENGFTDRQSFLSLSLRLPLPGRPTHISLRFRGFLLRNSHSLKGSIFHNLSIVVHELFTEG